MVVVVAVAVVAVVAVAVVRPLTACVNLTFRAMYLNTDGKDNEMFLCARVICGEPFRRRRRRLLLLPLPASWGE